MGQKVSTLRNFCGNMKTKYRRLGNIAPTHLLQKRRQELPKRLFMFDLEGLEVVKDHNGARKALMHVPGWVQQDPLGGYLEYWFYLCYDRERKFPAAKARLPWPLFQNAPIPILQAFVHVVNRVAHRSILCLM
ncbi:hypothetical protein R1flu_024005 [Riccia fluitans]|uniref:Uncharacterized protein n=1 Tax=Riccia fluitans TaxID=41844 RepID=A0ABD1XXQ9_9MARC